MLQGLYIFEFGDHAMRRCFAMRMTGTCNGQFGPHHQRMTELPSHTHGRGRNGAAVRRHKIHQTKTQGLNAGVRSNVKSMVYRQR